MLGLFVIDPWPKFYQKGMKTWEIRSYSIDYRGKILIISSRTNQVICEMELLDCVPLTKEMWEMNFHKHRTSCSFEDLPYNKGNKIAYAWVLGNPKIYKEKVYVDRLDKKPYITLPNNYMEDIPYYEIHTKLEKIVCKFINNTMLLFWVKKNYLVLIAIIDLNTGQTSLVTNDIKRDEIDYIVEQLNAK